jgi:hypothetical protein
MVMVSGSKFFMGAPFSGALLVPRAMASRAEREVPPGFRAYLTALDAPPAWCRFRSALSPRPNLGLVMRWRTALAEMQGVAALGREAQDRAIADVSSRVRAALSAHPRLEIIDAPTGERDGEILRWDSAQTIFPFVVHHENPIARQRTALDFDEAWQLYARLNRDLSAELPSRATSAERRLVTTACHIGQPVRVPWSDGTVAGALRIAIGARNVLDGGADDPRVVLDKLEIIVRYWPSLTAQSAVA